MNRIPVKSSNVESVGYENGTLEVKFLNGRLYQYHNVPESVHKTLMSGVSVGTYLAKNVCGKYHKTRIC